MFALCFIRGMLRCVIFVGSAIKYLDNGVSSKIITVHASYYKVNTKVGLLIKSLICYILLYYNLRYYDVQLYLPIL